MESCARVDFYSDNDRSAAAWLRELVANGHLPQGEVDETDIRAITGDDIKRFERVHLFAGIGGWPLALDLAGWPRNRPVWTGSCPCQPFSVAGKGAGEQDERHIWPEFFRLIRECRPATVFGEQVSGDDGYRWLAGVQADLEAEGYAFGAADLPDCSVGAPHIRQRLFWVVNAGQQQSRRNGTGSCVAEGSRIGQRQQTKRQPARRGATVGVAQGDTDSSGFSEQCSAESVSAEQLAAECSSDIGGLADAERDGGRRDEPERGPEGRASFWRAAQAVVLADGKARRIEPSVCPLVDGFPGRVGLLRGAGNAIVPQVAAEFIRAYLESGR